MSSFSPFPKGGLAQLGAIYDERFDLHRLIDFSVEQPVITITDGERNADCPLVTQSCTNLNFDLPVACAQAVVEAGANEHEFPEPTLVAPDLVLGFGSASRPMGRLRTLTTK